MEGVEKRIGERSKPDVGIIGVEGPLAEKPRRGEAICRPASAASHRRDTDMPLRIGGRPPAPARLNWAVAGVVALLVVGGSLLQSESRLRNTIARAFPVQAAEFIAIMLPLNRGTCSKDKLFPAVALTPSNQASRKINIKTSPRLSSKFVNAIMRIPTKKTPMTTIFFRPN